MLSTVFHLVLKLGVRTSWRWQSSAETSWSHTWLCYCVRCVCRCLSERK